MNNIYINEFNEIIYDVRLIKQIKDCLNNKSKLNKNKLIIMSEKLKELSILNDYTNVFKKNIELKNLNKEFILFNEIILKILNTEKKRKDSDTIKNNIFLIVKFLNKYILEKGFKINDIDYDNIYKEINIEKLFYICVSSCIFCLNKNFNHKDSLNFHENEIDTKKFIYELEKNLLLYLTNIMVNNNISGINILKDVYDNLDIISSECERSIKLSHQIRDVFEKIFEIKVRTIFYKNKYENYKEIRLGKIPEKIYKSFISPTHLPEILPPIIDYDSMEEYIYFRKKIKNGYSTIDMSENTKKALKISQNKAFKINKKTISLFKKLDRKSYNDIKDLNFSPFTPISHLKKIKEDIEKLESMINEKEKNIIVKEMIEIKKCKLKIKDLGQHIYEKFNIEIKNFSNIMKLHELKKEYKNKIILRKFHNTIIKLAAIFTELPLYYINSYDYRLRMYPWNYLFNRTSGIYKYLLIEYKETNITKKGLNNMLKAYDNNITEKNFKNIEIEKLNENDENKFYRYLLGDEINNIINKNKKKTGFLLEIDQKSSSTVLMSIALGDFELAKECNLIGNEPKDPAKKLMNESKEWYKNKISEESLLILSNERKLHKHLIMCFCYNQKYYGRIRKISEFIKINHDSKIISEEYPQFIDKTFGLLSIKKNLLNEIIKFYIKNTDKPITLNTIDGSQISWNIYRKENKKSLIKKKYNSFTLEKKVSYSHAPLIKEKDVNKIINGFMASLIHSLDGGIMREIILDCYKKNKYIINHLHDSIQFHPNQYENICESIIKIYCNEKLENFTENHVLKIMRNLLLPEKQEKFDELNKEFNEKFTSFKIHKNFLKIENMFPFE